MKHRRFGDFSVAVHSFLTTPTSKGQVLLSAHELADAVLADAGDINSEDAGSRQRARDTANRVRASLGLLQNVKIGRDWLLVDETGPEKLYGIKGKCYRRFCDFYRDVDLPDLPVE